MNERCVRWETPVSGAYVLMMKLSCHDGDLDITLDLSSATKTQDDIRFTFKKCPAFRSTLEKFRTSLCNNFSSGEQLGRTFIVENSRWIAELEASESIFSHQSTNIRHYVIAGDWEIIEVLSLNAPTVIHEQR
jgi:hypothetical protein